MADVPIFPEKRWTFLVYIAGDNNLDPAARLDLEEMKWFPSDEDLHVVVQFDSRAAHTYRYRFAFGRRQQLGDPLPDVNSGDPATLADFVAWGRQHFPAERTALVIWGHGTGLRDLPPDFDYSALRSGDLEAVRRELRHTLFAPTLDELARRRRRLRGIAIDATARDYLDTQKLAQALATGLAGEPLALLGFDACLMNVAEIAYQLRGLACYVVGSQEKMPGNGWPYSQILSELALAPEMDGRRLAETIVAQYADSTAMRGQESPFTQSALDLGRIEKTFALVQALADRLLLPDVQRNSVVVQAFHRIHQEVKRFQDRDLADLAHWCTLLRRNSKGSAGTPFRKELKALQAHLAAADDLIVATQAHGGDDAATIHGVSIYWPQSEYESLYDELDFAASGWGRLAKFALTLQ